MGVRVWAAIGNVLKISAAIGFLVALLIGQRAWELYQHDARDALVMETAIGAVVMLLASVLCWNLKGFLVRGNLIARVLIGLYMLGWVISTLGIGLVVIGIVYLFTGEPSTYDRTGGGKKQKPRFKAPSNWQPTAKVGPSGAMLYTDEYRMDSSGIFDSWTPVQVRDKRSGAAYVVAASGEGGWIDARTLLEGA